MEWLRTSTLEQQVGEGGDYSVTSPLLVPGAIVPEMEDSENNNSPSVLMPTDHESRIICAFNDPSFYDHPIGLIHRESTHASHVFIGSDFTYKIKRPVDYGFSNFSTLDRRKLFCEEELRLNRRFAPDLYIGVVPITENNSGALHLGGEGTPIEYALKMKTFDSGSLFSDLLEKGTLDRHLIEQITRSIARFHLSLSPVAGVSARARISKLTEGNFHHLLVDELPKSLFDTVNSIAKKTRATISHHKDLLDFRSSTHVRSVHGDLHLRNICLLNGIPTLFDGIEFNDDLSKCDVLADIAFLIMDLHVRGHPELAFLTLNTYLEETDDFGGLPLLSLYLSYRAMVRAKVEFLEFRGHENPSACTNFKDRIGKYLTYADSVLDWHEPGVVAIGGLSGSGKSTLARGLAGKIEGVMVRSDAVRKRLMGLKPTDRAPSGAYTKETNEKVYSALRSRIAPIAALGRAVLIDATFQHEHERNETEAFAKNLGLSFQGIWCETSSEAAKERILKRSEHGRDPSDASIEVRERQEEGDPGAITWKRLDTSGTVKESLNHALKLLGISAN